MPDKNITRSELARLYGISTRTLSRWLREAGYGAYKRQFTLTEKARLLTLWGDPDAVRALRLLPNCDTGTFSHSQLAAAYGISRHTLLRRCRDAGIAVPPSYLKPKDILMIVLHFSL
jgi:DNA invertase Pin-like site-specific DNA recombinase